MTATNSTPRVDEVDVRELAAIASAVLLSLLALPIGTTARLAIGSLLAVLVVVRWSAWFDRGSHVDSMSARWLAGSAGWLALSALWGLDPGLSLLWVASFVGFVGFGVSLVRWFGREVATRVLFAGLVPPVAIALMSIAGPLLADRAFDVSERVVVTKDMAAFFAVTIALLARFSPALQRLPRWAAGATYLAAAGVVLASDSRSMAVAAVIALGVGLVEAGRSRLVAAVSLAGLVGWAVAVLGLGVDAGGVFDLVSSDLAEGGGRDDLWAAVWAAMADRPLFGFGLGTHIEVLLEYRLESLYGIKSETTHNLVLLVGLAGGFPAMTLLVGSLLAVGRVAPKSLRVVLVAVVVFGLGDAPIETPGIVLVLLGMASVVDPRGSSSRAARRDVEVSDDRSATSVQRQRPAQPQSPTPR